MQRQSRLSELSSISFGLAQDGNVWIHDRNGAAVTTKSELDLIWREYASDLQAFLTNQLNTFGADAQLLARIHCDAPDPSRSRPFVAKPFDEDAPERPPPLLLPEPPAPQRAPKSFLGSITGANRKAREQSEADDARAHTAWEGRCQEGKRAHESMERNWREQYPLWEARKAVHDDRQEVARGSHSEWLETDPQYAGGVVRDALETLSWPREMSVGVSVDRADQVALDIDLPEIEDFPRQTASLHASGRRLVLKNKSEKQLRQEYAAHIHGVLLRLAGVAFWALPSVRSVMASGYSQRLNSATGHTEDQYLLSARIDRARYAQLNFGALDAIDPIEALSQFDLKRSMTAGFVFSPIQPPSER